MANLRADAHSPLTPARRRALRRPRLREQRRAGVRRLRPARSRAAVRDGGSASAVQLSDVELDGIGELEQPLALRGEPEVVERNLESSFGRIAQGDEQFGLHGLLADELKNNPLGRQRQRANLE